MRQRSIFVFGLAAAFIIVIWWMFVFSSVKTEVTDVQSDIQGAEGQRDTLAQDVDELKAIDPVQIQSQYDALSGTIAADPQLAEFIREADRIGVETGVRWVSVSPTEPLQNGSVAQTALVIEVEGDYVNVLHYLQALEGLSRMVVVDGITISGGASSETSEGGQADAGGPPVLHASLNARMFSLSAVAVTPPAATETGGS